LNPEKNLPNPPDKMKKFIILISIMIIGITVSSFARMVDIKDARLAGKNFYFERVNIHGGMPYNSLTIVEEFIEKDGSEPLCYIFNFKEKGFIIVSAEDACTPVLGYSFESSYKTENQPEAFLWIMNNFRNEISYVRQNNLLPDETIIHSWERLSTTDPGQLENLRSVTDVEPLISNDWNQDFPYNALCPEDPASGGTYNGHVPVGCVATSMTQIMYYWRYPEQGQGYHCSTHTEYGPQCADFGATIYDWDGMAEKPTKECDPVAILSWHGGIAVDMDWGPDGSGAYCSDVPHAMETYFKYSTACYYQNRPPGSSTTWKNKMKQNLDSKLPLQYSGHGAGGGHAWVCDGYQANDYFHFNFGWGGQSNGYYTIDNINPGGYTFNNNQGAVFDIMPDPAQYPYNCTGNVDDTTYNFGTIEDGSGPVADYQPNANCSWLIGANDSLANITLSFVRFNTLAGDEVKVYDGTDASAPLIGNFSGSTVPSPVTSTGPKIFVTFITDGSGSAPGWLASYNGNVIPFCESLTTLVDPAGNISDGSNNFSYRNSTNCKWKILPENATSVTLTFSYFNSEEDVDKLQVYDLGTGTLLTTYSGEYPDPPPLVTANSGQMFMIWSTDKTIRGEGWDASYTITVGTEEKELFNTLTIFPNPANDKVVISFNGGEPQNIKLELLSLTGNTLLTEHLHYLKGDFQKTLDVNSFSKGIYYLRLTGDSGISVKKLIVQ